MSKSGVRAKGLTVATSTLCFAAWFMACSSNGSDTTGSAGHVGAGGANATGSGGFTAAGGSPGSGGTNGGGATAGSAGGPAEGGSAGGDASAGSAGTDASGGFADAGIDSADATAIGGSGGMSFLLACSIATASNDVYTASSATNAPSISDFTYAGGPTGSLFSGDTYNQVTGYSYHFPDLPQQASGGAGGGEAGAGGIGGASGSGGEVGAAGHGGAGAGGHGGTGGLAGAGGHAGTGGHGGAGGAPYGGPLGISEDFSASNWHVTGWVGGDASAFVWQFTCLIDASAYDGVQFTIKGNAGVPNVLTMQASFAGDETGSYTTAGFGLCSGICQPPSTTVNLTSAVTTVQIPWSKFTGGRPVASVNPAQLVRFLWAFTSRPAAYPVDVTIDDLQFYSAPPPPTTDAAAGN
jgi:hypothetical protein